MSHRLLWRTKERPTEYNLMWVPQVKMCYFVSRVCHSFFLRRQLLCLGFYSAFLPFPQVDCRATQRLDQERAGLQAVQHAGIGEGKSRVQARLYGPEFTKNGGDADRLRNEVDPNPHCRRRIRPYSRSFIATRSKRTRETAIRSLMENQKIFCRPDS